MNILTVLCILYNLQKFLKNRGSSFIEAKENVAIMNNTGVEISFTEINKDTVDINSILENNNGYSFDVKRDIYLFIDL